MTGKEVRELSSEEITVELRRLRDKLHALKIQRVSEQVEDTSQFPKLRADIARLLTERRAREAASA
ncbi:MAG: 50S ribosomal protein L29 [Phycisphaerales bacterium]|nr:MAG: 50S ribosomal protein L29 [Phycisphaerales bacterium]